MRTFEYEETIVDVHEGSFFPTETSKLIIKYLKEQKDLYGSSLLDLGCGCGIVSLVLKRLGFSGPVHASDISESAVANALENFKKYDLEMTGKAGSMFDPWKSMSFDLIVDDVSGIAESIAKISPWFGTSISCDSGSDGTELTTQIIRNSPSYLKDGGRLIFPILTLSNYPKIIDAAEEIFEEVKLVNKQSFQFPLDLAAKHKDVLEKAIETKDIIVDYKFGMYIWETRIYEASSPRK
ncbi:Methyltransferase domain-containing protein [Maridesulfovibrio ferrireducens]|uniref:Methyltransferase domain-containing protein n=1 Tax=Maridesulfovibrio ferrireducens TaxID=246191 RepID=A0A1G9CLN9_9BACT|nr:methyltransferase [Maridesulfovibrio ferrireducens]SDK52528.1 Methyltransferase domain-containing protein [Maridesulfovibrio ferrireducens]